MTKKFSAKANRTWTIFVKPYCLINSTYLPLHILTTTLLRLFMTFSCMLKYKSDYLHKMHVPSMIFPANSHTICLSVNIRVVTLIQVTRSVPDANISREYQLLFGPCISTFLRELGLCLKKRHGVSFPVDAVCLSSWERDWGAVISGIGARLCVL